MNDTLLITKLHLPILRKDIIPREQLVERLNVGLWQENGFVRKLTLVSAPAGFGKTTLVSKWLSDLRLAQENNQIENPQPKIVNHVAWLSLDESDNDPARFFTYVIAALQQIHPEFGHQTEAILQLPQPPPPPVILTSLVNELSNLPPLILALDDYHIIHTLHIHQQLAFLLDHLSENMHLVILTREDPLLPIARLRARGQLLEIRQEDLRFSKGETSEFLRRETGLSLSADHVSALEQYTEGWVAGLQLAVLSLRGRDDLSTFVHDLTASDRYVLDYLIEEVFERQPVDVQDFLLQTSILKQLSSALCDSVTGHHNSAEVLHSLEQANLFIVPLDPGHTWYRYHHLFAELLHQRLRLSEIAASDLHQRACQWYEAQGLTPEAIEHALLAQDWGHAARLIGLVSGDSLKRGESATLLGWCAQLPQPVVFSSVELCLTQTWAALLTSQFEIAVPLLEHAEQMAAPGSSLLGQVASAQAFMARAKRDTAHAIEKSKQALALLPETDLANRSNLAMNLGLAYWHEGRLAEAEPVLLQACEAGHQSGNLLAFLTAQIFLARIPAAQGKLHQAAAMSENLIQAAEQIPILCLAHYDLATIHLEWNNRPKAIEHFDKGFTLAQRSGNVEFIQAGYLLRAILAHAESNEAETLAALTEAENMSRNFPAVIRSRTAAFGVQLALAHNDSQMLAHWLAQFNAEVDFHSFYRFIGLTRARVLLAQDEKAEAAAVLEKLYATASRNGWGYGGLVIRLLQGLAAKSPEDGLVYVAEALQTGRPENFIHSFLAMGAGIRPLLQEAARHGIEREYVNRILAALGAEKQRGSQNLVEPLSEREIEVLRLVTVGLSNREIALKLVISPGTAKTHIHNLCGKLGARNRTEAAMIAKEMNLA